MKSEENFKEGKYDGAVKEYFSNGQLAFEGMFKDGELNGEAKIYFDNGQIENESSYINNKLKVFVRYIMKTEN